MRIENTLMSDAQRPEHHPRRARGRTACRFITLHGISHFFIVSHVPSQAAQFLRKSVDMLLVTAKEGDGGNAWR